MFLCCVCIVGLCCNGKPNVVLPQHIQYTQLVRVLLLHCTTLNVLCHTDVQFLYYVRQDETLLFKVCHHQFSMQHDSEHQACSLIAKDVMYTATQPNKLSNLPVSILQYINLFKAFHDL